MSHIKSVFTLLLLTVIVLVVPRAHATVTVEATIAGSSAMWQSMALGAYALCGGASAGCSHWTSASNVINLTDTRVAPNNVDPGTIWVVWNSSVTKVWSFIAADSVVGIRCYFAQRACSVDATTANLSGSGSGQISAVLWGADSALPPALGQGLFSSGTPVTVAATEIRPEDALFAQCRVNSSLGAGTKGGAASDGLDGLGYNPNNAPGVCPAAGLSEGNYFGTPIHSGYPGSTASSGDLAFNIKGSDPITGTAIPAYSVVNVGAAPLIFVFERNRVQGQLANLTNATPLQLQQVFSGKNCDASAFGLPSGGIGVFLQSPLSGEMNTAEATLFRYPTIYPGSILGISQETEVGYDNPLAGQTGTCTSSNGSGGRYRAIGSGEAVAWVRNSNARLGIDGISYTFFSYGNVSPIANNSNYGYITLNNVDPIFASYAGGDPGEPGNGTLPAGANLPASCSGVFPCPENKIWTNGLSFPNLRNGTYPAWSVMRLVSDGTALTNARALAKASQELVVTSVPDFVPFVKTIAGGITDPGFLYLRSHYQQCDGAGTFIGAAPVNSGASEAGGDMGGEVLPSTSKTTGYVESNGGPVQRPTC